MKYRNRLSGEEREDVNDILLVGLWQAISEKAANLIAVDDYLYPNDSQLKTLPEQQESDTIRLIANRLQGLEQSEQIWLGWEMVSPLVPDIAEHVKMQALEQFILSDDAQHLHHLQQVCSQPRTHLRINIERLHVSRTRRVDKKAVAHLSAHTEDWEKRTLWGVQPRHILAQVRDEAFDIYENRVAVRLIDRLLLYVQQRIHQLQKILKTLEKHTSYEVVSGHHRLKDRIYNLWGGIFKDNQAENYTKKTLNQLQKIKYDLLGLMGSFLYKKIPRRIQVEDKLKITNILSNDTSYRSVGLLWQEWVKYGAPKAKTTEEKYQDYQNLCKGFNDFCLLLLIRALTQLQYEVIAEDEKKPLQADAVLRLQGWSGQLKFKINSNGLLQLQNDEQILLQILPLVAALDKQKKATQNKAYLELVEHLLKTEKTQPITLILYSGEADDNLPICLHSLPHEHEGLLENLGIMPVSPWEIASVEHVARAVRWALMSVFMLDYPPKIKLDKPLEKLPKWLKKQDNKTYYVLDKVPTQERNQWLATQRSPLSHEVERLNIEIENEFKQNRNSKKHNYLQNELKGYKEKLETLKIFENAFSDSESYFKYLYVCPVCHINNFHTPNILQVRDHNTFSCLCPACKAKWELRLCNNCGERYPVLIPDITLQDIINEVGWIDKHLGMDVLSIPSSSSKFKCAFCYGIKTG